ATARRTSRWTMRRRWPGRSPPSSAARAPIPRGCARSAGRRAPAACSKSSSRIAGTASCGAEGSPAPAALVPPALRKGRDDMSEVSYEDRAWLGGFGPDRLDAFVAMVDGIGGPAVPEFRALTASFGYLPQSRVDQSL